MGQKTDSLFSRMLFTVGFGAHVALQLLGLFGSALPFPGVVSPDVALACQTLFFVSLISATALLANNVNWVISHARLAVTLKRLLPSVWVVFLLFPLLPFEGRIGCCCVILGALVYNHINYNILLLTRSMRHRLNPITHEFVSENPHWLGMLVGIVLAFFAFYQFPLSDVELLIAEIVCFVFAAVYLLKGGIDSAGRQGPSCLDGASSEASRADQALDEQSFDEACDALMERVGLTKREMDVFRLLARGRNNEYISNKLFISRATTKTHIYHIYAKTGVNSQQDLINFVEQELEEDRRRP